MKFNQLAPLVALMLVAAAGGYWLGSDDARPMGIGLVVLLLTFVVLGASTTPRRP